MGNKRGVASAAEPEHGGDVVPRGQASAPALRHRRYGFAPVIETPEPPQRRWDERPHPPVRLEAEADGMPA
jgi:hypothetical protein